MKVIAAILFTALWTSSVEAQRRPTLPFVDKGACPGECCVYRDWTALRPIRVHRLMSLRAPTVFTIRRGEHVTALTGTVVTTRAGVARVTAASAIVAYTDTTTVEEHVSARRGEVLYLLTPLGEGYYTTWFRGRLLGSANVIDLLHTDPDDVAQGTIEREPTIVWWAQVRNAKGLVGWTNQTDDFGNQDSCGP